MKAGDKTRQQLIESGIEMFGLHGYEAATTRMLADNASANMAAIPYHFGGKEGLYSAVIKHVCEKILEGSQDERERVRETIADEKATPDELLDALDSLVRGLGRIFISSDLGQKAAPLIMWEQARPSKEFDQLYDDHFKHLHELVTILAARFKGVGPESEEAIICAHAIIGQVVGFRFMRETARRRLGWETFDDERTMKICDVIIANTRRILSGGC